MDCSTLYPRIGLPPLLMGADQLSVACALPATVERFDGAAAGPNGTTAVVIGVP